VVLSRVCNEYQAHVVAYSQDFLPDLGEQVPGLRVFFVRVQPFQVVIGHARSRAVVGGGSLNVEVSESAAGAFLGDDYRVPRMGLQGGWMCSRVRRFSRASVACHENSWPVAVRLVSGGHLQGNLGCARYLGLCARRWQVILVFRGRDDFRGNAVAPLRELLPV